MRNVVTICCIASLYLDALWTNGSYYLQKVRQDSLCPSSAAYPLYVFLEILRRGRYFDCTMSWNPWPLGGILILVKARDVALVSGK